MTEAASPLRHIILSLRYGSEAERLHAAISMRNPYIEANDKGVIKEAGGIQALLQLLDQNNQALAVASAETLACLAAEDAEIREAIRALNGIELFVRLVSASIEIDCTQRALLALRILTESEADRLAIVKAGGVAKLVTLLLVEPTSDVTEFATAALGDLAAGGPFVKDAIREAGGIVPLVDLVKKDPDSAAAELAAVALRNMALQNEQNRLSIVSAGGLQPWLQLLWRGLPQLVQPLQCEVVYMELNSGDSGSSQFVASQCCFDPKRAELCVAPRMSESIYVGCFAKSGREGGLRDKTAERYCLLRKLTMREPNIKTLELGFMVSNSAGAPRIVNGAQQCPRLLQRIIISPCPALEMKGAIMRMLTRSNIEREFKTNQSVKGSPRVNAVNESQEFQPLAAAAYQKVDTAA